MDEVRFELTTTGSREVSIVYTTQSVLEAQIIVDRCRYGRIFDNGNLPVLCLTELPVLFYYNQIAFISILAPRQGIEPWSIAWQAIILSHYTT